MKHLILPAAAALALAVPGVAVAKGGGSGTVYTGPITECDYALDGPTADGGYVFSNQVAEAGCLSVVNYGSTLRVYNVAASPGWSYTVTANGEGTNSRVAVTFTYGTLKREARIEFGKTVIR